MASFFDDYASGNALGEVIRKGARKAVADTALTKQYGGIAGDPEAAASLQQTDQRAQAFPTAKAQGEANLEATQAANTKNADTARDKAMLNAAYFVKQRYDTDGPEAGAAAVDDAAKLLGLSPEDAAQTKQFVTSHPQGADALIEALKQRYASSSAAGGAQRYQIVQQPDGSIVRVPVTGEGDAQAVQVGGEAVRGYQAPQGQQRIVNTQANTQQRYDLADPNLKAEQEAGKAVGKVSGGEAVNLPEVENIVSQAKDRITQIRQDPNVRAIFGVPTIAKAIQSGGFGKLGTTYGSGAADAAAKVTALISQLRLQAYKTLKGGGSITEQESQFGAEGTANLDRSQSYESFIAELDRLEGVLDKGVATARTKAHMTNFGKKVTAPVEAAPRSQSQTSDLSDAELLKLYAH